MNEYDVDDQQDDDLDLMDPIDTEDVDDGASDDGDDGSTDEPHIGFEDDGDDAPDDTPTVRQMRGRIAEQNKKIRQLEQAQAAVEPEIVVGDEPTMEDGDVDYDADRFKEKWTGWNQRKAAAAQQQSKQSERRAVVQQEWQDDLTRLEADKASLGVTDMADAEEAVRSVLSLEQQAVMVQACDKPAAFLYALSKSPGRMAELAKIDNPVKMAAAVARMERGVKVMTRRKAAEPDSPKTGNARPGGSSDKRLAKLEAEASKSGDRSDLIAYKSKMKKRA